MKVIAISVRTIVEIEQEKEEEEEGKRKKKKKEEEEGASDRERLEGKGDSYRLCSPVSHKKRGFPGQERHDRDQMFAPVLATKEKNSTRDNRVYYVYHFFSPLC